MNDIRKKFLESNKGENITIYFSPVFSQTGCLLEFDDEDIVLQIGNKFDKKQHLIRHKDIINIVTDCE